MTMSITRSFANLLCGGILLAGCAGPMATAPEIEELATPSASEVEALASAASASAVEMPPVVVAPVTAAPTKYIKLHCGSSLRTGPENQPLYVIDDVPQYDLMSRESTAEAVQSLNEILAIEVIKSSAAIELYGEAARNGAILIRTR